MSLARASLLAFGLVVTALAGALALGAADLGMLSRHMGVHLLLMNALAPLIALARRHSAAAASGRSLVAAAALQMIALWTVHAPLALVALAHAPAAQLPIHAVLFALALWFWTAVMAQRGADRWRALVALLLTGKLACLLGVLLIFAPRTLYPGLVALADQQQAGLWMTAACLLTYVAAATAIALRWLHELGLGPVAASR